MKSLTASAVALLSMLIPSALNAQDVGASSGVNRAAQRQARPGPAENFTGRVTVAPIASPSGASRNSIAMVSFSPQARTNWHSHPAGQNLFVTEGCGWTQRDGGPVERICAGDAVFVPAGVRHWHGATDATAMKHLAITEQVDGKNVSWAEPVSDAQYRQRDQ